MKKEKESALELQIKQFRLLDKVCRIWALKSDPGVPCFEIDRDCDGTYSLSFMGDKEDIISHPYLIASDENLNIVLLENSSRIGYDPQTGELLSGDKAYIPFKSMFKTAKEWREHLAGILEKPDDPEEKKTLEYNRRIILNWICCEWIPESKKDVPNILISRSIPSEYELRFLKEGHMILPEACLIEQDYEAFFFCIDDYRIDITYFPGVDQILVGGTYYERAAVEKQQV